MATDSRIPPVRKSAVYKAVNLAPRRRVTSGAHPTAGPFSATSGRFPIVPTIPVYSQAGLRLVVETEVREKMYADYFPCRADDDTVFIVDQSLVGSHRLELFEFELGIARERMDEKANAADKQLFNCLIAPILKRMEGVDYVRHYAFMVDEASRAGGDYLTAAAIMLHDIKTDAEIRLLAGEVPLRGAIKQSMANALATRRRFLNLEGIVYRPPAEKMQHFIQNFMDALICASEGDSRALLMRVIHRFSSHALSRANEERWIRSTHHIYAALAERFGLTDLAVRLHDTALRLEQPEAHRETEAEILVALKFNTRREAEEYADGLRQKAEAAATAAGREISALPVFRSRIKNPWSVRTKLDYKPELYPSVDALFDLAGVACITRAPLYASTGRREVETGLAKAIELARAAAGENFVEVIYRHGGQEETQVKTIRVGERNLIYYHVSVRVAVDGNPTQTRVVEFQFLDEETYRALAREVKPHWAYRLKMIAGQEFDFAELLACGKKMTGNFLEDVRAVYEFLSGKWVYVYYYDPKSTRENPLIWVKRRQKGSISADAAAFINRGSLALYSGIKARKIWEHQRPAAKAAETRELETGDLIFFDRDPKPVGARELLGLSGRARHLITRFALYLASGIEPRFDLAQAAREGETALRAEFKKISQRFDRDRLSRIASSYEMTPEQLLATLAFEQANFISAREIAEQMHES